MIIKKKTMINGEEVEKESPKKQTEEPAKVSSFVKEGKNYKVKEEEQNQGDTLYFNPTQIL